LGGKTKVQARHAYRHILFLPYDNMIPSYIYNHFVENVACPPLARNFSNKMYSLQSMPG
jgi:hypothetical protein